MKKSIIASVVALGMISGLVQAANDQHVTFTGSVTTVTCDLEVSGDGVNGKLPNMVDLGQAKLGENGGEVKNFTFKPSQIGGNQAACDAMEASKTATLTWFGTTFNGTGLGKNAGTAEGAIVKLMATNANTGSHVAVTASGTAHEFSGDKLRTGGEGLKYSAQLIPGSSAGSFEAVASYAFDYK